MKSDINFSAREFHWLCQFVQKFYVDFVYDVISRRAIFHDARFEVNLSAVNAFERNYRQQRRQSITHRPVFLYDVGVDENRSLA